MIVSFAFLRPTKLRENFLPYTSADTRLREIDFFKYIR